MFAVLSRRWSLLFCLGLGLVYIDLLALPGCGGESTGTPNGLDAAVAQLDGATPKVDAASGGDAGAQLDATAADTSVVPDAASDAGVEAGVVIPPGLIDPIPYLSFQDSP